MKIEEFKKLQKKYLDSIKNHGKDMMIDYFQEIFDKVPKLKYVFFAAYTPYFNDGDACIYSVHDPNYLLEDDKEFDNVRDALYERESYFYKNFDTSLYEEFVNWQMKVPFDEIVFQGVFGEGLIIFERNQSGSGLKVTVEEYNHD